jgi:ADP-ribosyl-[dinitrogen reductase] hydrolase
MKDKYKGCLVGLAVGDALGAPLEFWLREEVIEYVQNKGLEMVQFKNGSVTYGLGFYTDDTAMTICLAESLIEKGFDLDHQIDLFKKWLIEGYATPEGRGSYGVGQQTLKCLLMKGNGFRRGVDSTNENASGNGTLMRIAPIALKYNGNFDEIKEKSLHASYLTHNNEVAGWACVVLNTLISLSIEGREKRESMDIVLNMYEREMPNEILQLMKHDYENWDEYMHPISGYSVDTLRIALWAWLTSKNFEDSIKKAILTGNDADTFAAVTGSLAGACYGFSGIPNRWSDNLARNSYIENLASRIYDSKS